MRVAKDRVRLPYGRQAFTLNLAALPRRPTVLSAPDLPANRDPAGAISRAMQEPIGAPPLREIVKRGDRVVILVSDLTRPTGADLFMPVLRRLLNSAGVRDQDIVVLFTLGMHRPNTPEEKRRIVGAEVASRIRMLDNDARDEKAHVFL